MHYDYDYDNDKKQDTKSVLYSCRQGRYYGTLFWDDNMILLDQIFVAFFNYSCEIPFEAPLKFRKVFFYY